MQTHVSFSFSASLYMRMYAQKPMLTAILSRNAYLRLNCILLMLSRICAGSPEAMQQADISHDIVQSRMNHRCSRGLAPRSV